MTKQKLNLWCNVVRMEIDFKKKSGKLYVEEYECPDMTAAIRFFKNVLPTIKTIETYSGNVADTIYILSKGNWEAFDRQIN